MTLHPTRTLTTSTLTLTLRSVILAGLLEDNAAAYLGELIAVLTHAGAMPLSPRGRACLRRCQGEEEIQVKLLQAANTMWCLQGTEGLVPEEGVKDVALLP